MLLRVRCGATETLVEGKGALARLYRSRRVAPDDLVWHPVLERWVAVESFLFVDPRRGDGRGPWSPWWPASPPRTR